MRDPFAPNSNSSVIRDAQVGLLLVAVLLGVFVYVAYYRVTGQGRTLPEHVRMAPVATAVWPNGPPEDPTSEFSSATSPSTIAATHHPPQLHATTNARNNRAPSQITTTPDPVRTDRRVSPVDFQQPEPSEGTRGSTAGISTREEALSRLGLKPGDKLDASKIRKVERSNSNNIFGSRSKSPKSIVRPPSLVRPIEPQSSPLSKNTHVPKPDSTIGQQKNVAGDAAAQGTPLRKLSRKSGSPGSSEPETSIFEARSKPKPKPLSISETLSIKKTNVDAANLNSVTPSVSDRPSVVRPRMMSPVPSLRPFTKKKETQNAFKTMPNPSRPIAKQIASVPQQDIARTATAMPSDEPKSLFTSGDTLSATKPVPKSVAPTTTPPDLHQNLHLTKEGDSFWSLASSHYGDGRYFHALFEWNRGAVNDFDHLPANTKIDLPDLAVLRRRWPNLCPKDEPIDRTIPRQTMADYESQISERLYITKQGDTLFEIAAKALGQASRYVEIISKNDQRLPAEINHLAPLDSGIQLVLPD